MFNLPRLQRRIQITGDSGYPTMPFHVWWDRVAKNLENQFLILQEFIADIVPISFAADSGGIVTPSSQLPKSVGIKRYQGTTDVTALSTWSMSVRTGTISASIEANTGILTITAISSNSVIDITSTREVAGQVLTLTKPMAVFLDIAAPAITGGTGGGGGGSGGTTATDTTFLSFNSTSMTTVSDVLTVTVGSGGRVDLTAPLGVTTGATSPVGNFAVSGIWQWDSTGAGAWVDLGTATSNFQNTLVTTESGHYYVDDGGISVTSAKTGLGVGSNQKFRFQMKNNSGTRTMYVYGTVTAAGS